MDSIQGRQGASAGLMLLAVILAFSVITLGAYVRLSDAGLGCPDWPGCYGQLVVPKTQMQIEAANSAYPDRPLESGKAWKEMAHRYLASALGLVIVWIAIQAWRHRGQGRQQLRLPFLLVALVIFQGMLGMWTVTLLLKPAVVTLHLLMGMLTLALLWLAYLRQRDTKQLFSRSRGWRRERLKPLARLGLLLLFCQIALGGWTSTNYAALHCPDFPLCQGQWWPPTDFKEAFTLWREVGVNYEGGRLSNQAAVTVHLSHRIGALVTFLTLGLLGLMLLRRRTDSALRTAGAWLLVLLLLQVGLGISNVLLHLPTLIAVAHNGGAALLLLIVVKLNYQLTTRH
ncbi:COX15/CtaA family protein [Aestuariirhabdus sp. Z084]|uniref:COX15/CtaA family protein n=1 Tax=Aestuariirhabdus haliotis TaxID=2918751 RepID=UPI00201B3B9A|nr:COX15/CtaA family protein [Aestuariirhabdus haliotis]MCL6414276.1 COX15/CtaA family protein [Aestuariirhabdus haliotis]MCL6418208.1 COX15/CtaA family protein [Aestuariirhabdus haliotis]